MLWFGLENLTNKHKGGQGGNQYERTSKHIEVLRANGKKQGAINGKNANYGTDIMIDGIKYKSKRAYARAMGWSWSSKTNARIEKKLGKSK